MNILTVYAHPNPKSFCHVVLEQFCKGLTDAGHTNKVLDLYASGFNLVLTAKDYVYWFPDENAPDVVDKVAKRRASEAGLLQRIIAWLVFRNKSSLQILASLRARGPRDVREQQEKVARVQALVSISPVWFVGFAAILKGWIERVFTLGFAYSLTSAGWHGDIRGRIPMLKHDNALIINTTIFNQQAYQEGLGEAMKNSSMNSRCTIRGYAPSSTNIFMLCTWRMKKTCSNILSGRIGLARSLQHSLFSASGYFIFDGSLIVSPATMNTPRPR